jgi:hypothetical protein
MQKTTSIKHNADKPFMQIILSRFLRKKEAKKETKEWASPMNLFIRFAEALASMHVLNNN